MIGTDTTNILIRALQQKQVKPRSEPPRAGATAAASASASASKELKRSVTDGVDSKEAQESSEQAAKRIRTDVAPPSSTTPTSTPAAAAAAQIKLPPIPTSGINTLTKTQLTNILRAYNLPVSGSKVRDLHCVWDMIIHRSVARGPLQDQLVARVTQLQHRRKLEAAQITATKLTHQ